MQSTPKAALLLLLLVLAARGGTGESVRELEDEYWEACRRYVRELTNAIERRAPREEWPTDPGPEYYGRFAKLAKERQGQPDEVAVLAWLFDNAEQQRGAPGRDAAQRAVFERLAEIQPDGTVLARRVSRIEVLDEAWARAVRLLLEHAKAPETRAWALRRLAEGLYDDGFGEQRAMDEADGAVRELLRKHPKSRAAAGAAELAFALRHLRVGRTPPDFEATDSQGVKFRLRDYRGKVVVLVFWGFW